MMVLVTALALGVPLFAVTNIDDLFVLLGFFSDPRFHPRNIVIGQFAGIGVLAAVSVLAALIALVILSSYIGLLGLAPIAIGSKRLFDLARHERTEAHTTTHAVGMRSQAITVAAVTIANGGDNIGVYTPLFAVHRGIETTALVVVFALMTVVWCWLAHWLVSYRMIGGPIRRYGQRLLPLVLIGLGVSILIKAGTFELLSKILNVR